MADGTIEQADGTVTFRYERQLHHPVGTVWNAITDPAEIQGWSGGRVEIELKQGGAYISYHGEGIQVADRIVRLEPPALIAHTFWVHVNPGALVTWELRPAEEGCVLALTHSLTADDLRSAAETVATGDSRTVILSRNAAGWHRLLDKLEAWLDGRSLEWTEEDQRAFQARYAAALPQAGVGSGEAFTRASCDRQ